MSDRTVIKISRIVSRIGTSDLQGNWVTIGVVVHKTEPRTSSSVSLFVYCLKLCITLFNLKDSMETLTLTYKPGDLISVHPHIV